MIIQLAGTSGSGKTTAVRELMKKARLTVTNFDSLEKKNIVGYDVSFTDVTKPLHILGSYEPHLAAAGADTFRKSTLFDMIEEIAEERDVLFEGLWLMHQQEGPRLAAEFGRGYKVLHLNTSLHICKKRVFQRRKEYNITRDADPVSVQDNYTRARNFAFRMRDAGAEVVSVQDEQVSTYVLGWLKQ